METTPARTSARRTGPRTASRPARALTRRRTGAAALALALTLGALPVGAAAQQAAPAPRQVRADGAAPGVVHPAPGGAGLAASAPATTGGPGPEAPARVAYGWPTGAEAAVMRPFDAPAQAWLPGHRGVDLLSTPGAPVRAAADGVVAFAGSVAGRPLLSVDHADGIRTTYEPVAATVAAGSPVRRGDVIGTLVADPRLAEAAATDPDSSLATHAAGVLHWGARTGKDTYVDPLSLLRPVVIRLLPL